jgi:hypothetical protein
LSVEVGQSSTSPFLAADGFDLLKAMTTGAIEIRTQVFRHRGFAVIQAALLDRARS